MGYYMGTLQKYCSATGRAGRKEYWLTQLFHFIILFLLSLWDTSMDLNFSFLIPQEQFFRHNAMYDLLSGIGFFSTIYQLAVFLPMLCLQIRRLHDHNSSAWWLLFHLVPFGSIGIFIFNITPGTNGPNRYGDPVVPGNPASGTPNPVYPGISMGASKETPSAAPLSPEAEHPKPEVRYCRRCGGALKEHSRFCTWCGTEVIQPHKK